MSITDGFPIPQDLLKWAESATIKTLPDLFKNSVALYGDKNYVGRRENGRYVFKTYNQVYEEIKCFASALLGLGLSIEDRIANFSNNRPEWPVVDFGCGFAGLVHVPMYPTLSQQEMAYIVKDSGSRIVIGATKDHVSKILNVLEQCPQVEHVVAIDPYDNTVSLPREHIRFWTWAELMAFGQEQMAKQLERVEEITAKLKPEDICSLVYTSGTTGDPKGAMLMHGNFTSATFNLAPIINIGPGDIELSFLPLSHVFERIAYYVVTSQGASIGYARGIQSLMQDLQNLHPTLVPSVPRLFDKVYARVRQISGAGLKKRVFEAALRVGEAYHKAKKAGKISPWLRAEYALARRTVFSKIHATLGGRVKYFISGGAPLRNEVGEFFVSVGLCIMEGYGLTETSPVLTLNPPDDIHVGTVGKVVPGVELRLEDDGEIVARGSNIMRGYFGRLKETQDVIDEQGWFHTGDIGEIDAEGFVTITDRKKEILVLSNGKNVAPQPIERAISSSELIDQAILVGNNRNYVGALVIPDFERLEEWAKAEGLSCSQEELVHLDAVRSKLMAEVRAACTDFSNYEKVKRIAVLERKLLASEGEITPTLKVKRRIVSSHFRQAEESIFAQPEASDFTKTPVSN